MPAGDAHVVLASTDGHRFASLRRPATRRQERYALGRALRQQVPRSALGRWGVPANRLGPVQQVMATHVGRVDRLIPVRVGRMVTSPYGFLRGAAAVMAADFALLPATGITPVICGDAHLGNFGFYASPERELVLDLNDFDEAHPGGWEWDLRRLATSVWVAGRHNGASESSCEEAVSGCVKAYRQQLADLAEQPLLSRSYQRLDVDRLRLTATKKSLRKEIKRAAKRAKGRTSDRALPRLTEVDDGTCRILEDPPLVTRPTEDEYEQVAEGLDDYLQTLPPQWGRILAGYRLVDIVHKVVGVGSVGLRAYLALCEGSSPDDVVFLQLKQARRSVVARYVHGDSAWHDHQGRRVVEYQQALQTVSDPLLGWATIGAHQYYVRQWRNMKGAITISGIGAAALADYAGTCGVLLAKGHARTSGASMIAGYLGGSGKIDRAMGRFARAYADQTERDHQALVTAVARGVLPSD
ncbi:MAG: DUF2252 domain-containing protein [Actinomycetota bacterium]|nr:DUF2252 domain-containing protein [Actinomycetota bacterium]